MKDQFFISRLVNLNKKSIEKFVEIVLVEDNYFEAELTIKALEKNHLANKLLHIDDGEEALNFIFCRGKYHKRSMFRSQNYFA